ncbi:MAG: hypothetical protein MJZ63_04110 [Muribaculaceae bacterium]|nr:hypothetical protein [Muribaculaceae bacterium]
MMKHRFLKMLFTVFTVGLAIILIVKFSSLAYIDKALDFNLPKEKKVLVLGSSFGEDAIDDSILNNWSNKCHSADMLFCTYVLLNRYLEKNQVDTVLVQLDEFGMGDDAYISTNYLLYESSRMAIAGVDVVKDLVSVDAESVLSFYLLNDLFTLSQKHVIGGYENWHHQGLTTELQELDAKLKKNGKMKLPKFPLSCYSLQNKYLTKIIELCKRKGVQLVLVNYPKYKRGMYYDRSVVWDYYTTLDDSVKIAEYENFEFPDTSYYANSGHLNYRGAAYFSSALRREGLKLQSPKSWCATRHD